MAITITDDHGRQYRLSDTEDKLLQPLLERNAEARAQLITAIVEFDNRRLKLLTDVVLGKPTPGYGITGNGWQTMPAIHKPAAIRDIRTEYDDSIRQLHEVLGEGAEDMISASRARTASRPPQMLARRR